MKHTMKFARYYVLFSIAAAGMWGLIWLSTGSTAESSTPSIDCESIQRAVNGRIAQLGTMGKGTVEHAQLWLTMVNLIVDSPSCFSPQEVATAKTGLQQYLDH